MDTRRASIVVIVMLVSLFIIWALLSLVPMPKGGVSYFAVSNQTGAAQAISQNNTITLHHSLLGTTHSYEGTLLTPTPCHTVDMVSNIIFGNPTKLIVELSTEAPNNACPAQVTEQPFAFSYTSTSSPEVSVLVDGKTRPVTVIER